MYQQNQLPVSYQQIDTSCFSNMLPQNDRVPQVNTPGVLRNNPQMVGYITGLFRKRLQDGAQRSPVHTVAYNLLASNGFQNQVYQYWCQRAVDLLAVYMIQAGGNQNEQLIHAAATEVSESFLGFVWSQYQQTLMQLVDSNIGNALNQAAQRWQAMEQKIQMVQQQMAQPQFNTGGYNNQSLHQGHAAFSSAVTGTATVSHQMGSAPTQNSNSAGEGVYATMQPVQSFDSNQGTVQNHGNAPVTSHTTNYDLGAPNVPVVPVNAPQAPVREPEYVPAYDVVVDPEHYPNNRGYNEANKYDYITVNDDTWIMPMHRADTVVERDSPYPFPEMADPSKYMSFAVCYSNGKVREKLVEITEDMKYLEHELNDELKRRYHGAKTKAGRVVTRTDFIADYNGDSETDATTLALRMNLNKDPLELAKGLPLYIISDLTFSGGTDMEVEKAVNDFLKSELKADLNVLPTHEYHSRKEHYLDITENGYKIISSLSNCVDFATVGSMLKEALRVGNLTLRTFNFVDGRLTDAINEFIKDSLSDDEVKIDSFTSDIMDLLEYYESSKPKVYDALVGGFTKIISRAVTIIDSDDGYAIVDDFVNIQTHWMLDELTHLQLQKGEAVLISQRTNTTLTQVLRETIKRNAADLPYARYRLITTDGIYLEMVKGHLMENINMLKRI